MITKNTNVDWDHYYDYYYGEHVPLSDRSELIRQWQAHGNFYIKWLQHIDNIIPLYRKNLKTFEIGSGLGGVLQLLHDHGVPIAGSDISKKAVSVGMILNPDISYIYFNAEAMVLPEKKYDRILAFEVLEHIDRLDIAFEHIRRGLKKTDILLARRPIRMSNI